MQTRVTYPNPGKSYLYNRQNMLTRVEDVSSNLIASYTCDALNRRIEKTVAGSPDVTTRFYYPASWQLIEETDAVAIVQRDYVWAQGGGAYVDDLLLMRDVIGTSGTANADYFVCCHHHFNVVAMLDNTGAVVERYDYNPYGKRFILDSDYTADADGISDVGLNFGHQGLYHDGESELIYNRNRMLNTKLGRFFQRDPLEYVNGLSQYQDRLSRPNGFPDPFGLDTYRQNRQLGGKNAKGNGLLEIYSHTFIFTTNPDGTINHTYSWGNTANTHGWNKDQPEDITAANQALKGGGLNKVGGADLDWYIDNLFNELKKPKNDHKWWPWNQCKTEASSLTLKVKKKKDYWRLGQ